MKAWTHGKQSEIRRKPIAALDNHYLSGNNYYMVAGEEQPLTDALRRAIHESGLSFKALEKETGVLRQSLMKFMRGEQSLRLDIADRLACYFNLEVKPKKKGR